jgi:peptidoglycan/LPS O-acetylase OafA/YrhL
VRYMSLTSLRGIAALIVVLSHSLLIFAAMPGIENDAPFGRQEGAPAIIQKVATMLFTGTSEVTFFFVLSGFVLVLALRTSGGVTPHGVAAYYIRRFFRLAPLIAVSVLLAIVLLPLAQLAASSTATTQWVKRTVAANADLEAIISTITCVRPSLNPPLWSLFFEILFSVIFPVIFVVVSQSRWRLPALFGSAAIGFLPVELGRDTRLFLFSFLIGAALHYIPKRNCARPAITAFAILLIFLLWRTTLPDLGWTTLILVESICSAALIYFVAHKIINVNWLGHPAMVFVGEISFGIYVLHFPILLAIAGLSVRLFPQEIAHHPILWNLAMAIVCVSVVVPLAAAAHFGIERPFQDVGKRLARILAHDKVGSRVRLLFIYFTRGRFPTRYRY